MPYKFEANHTPIPEVSDKRIKIPKSEHANIIQMYQSPDWSMRKLAEHYGVDKRTIGFIIYPERLAQARANRDWRNYYDKAKHAQQMKAYRQRKQTIVSPKRAE